MRSIKNLLSLVLVVVMVFGLTASAFADDSADDVIEYAFDEAEYYDYISNADENTLKESGLTKEMAARILSDYYSAIYDRAELSYEELIALGYTEAEINTIQSIIREQPLSKEQIRAITATCTGTIYCTVMNSNECNFAYTWNWSSCPLINLKDEVAAKWIAFNSGGVMVDSDVVTSSCVVRYYNGSSLIHVGYGFIDTSNENFYAIGYKFESMYYYYIDDPEDVEQAYAKTGVMVVRIASNPGGTFDHVKVVGKYGHTTLITSSIGFSVSSSNTLDLNFTPALGISTVGLKKVNISFGPVVTPLNN